jgi:hypothetical protein
VQNLRERPHRLDHRMPAMRMTAVPKALLCKPMIEPYEKHDTRSP